MKLFTFVILAVLTCVIIVAANSDIVSDEDIPRTYIKVRVSVPEEAEKLIDLGLFIEANTIYDGIAEGLISKKNLEKVRNAGFKVEVVDEDIEKTFNERDKNAVLPRKPWYDFEGVRKELVDWANQYSSISKLDTAGYSINGKPIWELRIFSAQDTAARQRFYINGATHGNEKIGTEIAMRIANHLLTNYNSDPKIKEIVNRSEFVFHPIINPDGFIAHRRTLSNGKDPNRAFGYQVGGEDGSYPYEWPEMKAYRDALIEAPCYFNFDYHCGKVELMKPFFTSVTAEFDLDAYQKIGGIYILKGGHHDYFYTIARGGHGIACDGAFGKCGSMSFLPEVSQHDPAESQIEQITEYNRDCVLDVINEIQKGVCGRVTDSKTGVPLFARIQVKGSYAAVFTHQKSGAYFKYISSPSGTYEVTAFANGYNPETKTVQANPNSFANLDFALVHDPDLKYAALSLDAIRTYQGMGHSDLYKCLEAPDGNGTTINSSGSKAFVNLDFGPKMFITNHASDDFTVHSTNNTQYTVSVAYNVDDLEESSNVAGTGTGTASFDLANAGLDSARFVQISCTSGSPCIDAVEAEPRDDITGIKEVVTFNKMMFPRVTPLFDKGVMLQAYIPKGQFSVKVYDLKGKMVSTIGDGNAKASGIQTFFWHGLNRNGLRCARGTYIFHVNCTGRNKAVKAPILW